MVLLGCLVAGSALQASSQSLKRVIPIVQLSNSCDVAGLKTLVCSMASSIAGEENEFSMGGMMTNSMQWLLMLEPSTTSP